MCLEVSSLQRWISVVGGSHRRRRHVTKHNASYVLGRQMAADGRTDGRTCWPPPAAHMHTLVLTHREQPATEHHASHEAHMKGSAPWSRTPSPTRRHMLQISLTHTFIHGRSLASHQSGALPVFVWHTCKSHAQELIFISQTQLQFWIWIHI